MSLDYKAAESLEKPLEVDSTSSPSGVYVRQNITATIYKDSDGADKTKYCYEEAFLTSSEYEQYRLVNSVIAGVELKREGEIIDAYTLKLIEEGTL